MELFLNELAFCGQCRNTDEAEAALQVLLHTVGAFERTRNNHGPRARWLSSRGGLGGVRIIAGEPLPKTFNALRDIELKRWAFRLNHRIPLGDWCAEQQHDSVLNWAADGRRVADTSVAEVAERVMTKPGEPRCLVAITNGWTWGLQQLTVHEGSREAHVDCISGPERITAWVKDSGYPIAYDAENLTRPPSDEETCLIDETLFERTSLKKNQGRTMYRLTTTGNLFCVDNLHYGASAQLEVFRGKAPYDHLGVADIANGSLDVSSKVGGRKYDPG